uniref:Defensin-like protein 1 n=1 Tax=Nelumbo nucifera TaxID=4432 RepID=A0A822XEF1_NELNU|nr:TPA_asm: hypothetical protein HUJ06_021287 [Nelumbo nucifera]
MAAKGCMTRNAMAILFLVLFFSSIEEAKGEQICVGSCWVIWNCGSACHRFGLPKGGNCFHFGHSFKCCCDK